MIGRARPGAVGTLRCLAPVPLITFLNRVFAALRDLLRPQRSCITTELPALQLDHAFAAFEQGDWLAELDLLQLGDALHSSAISRGGYDGRSFDLIVSIADVLEADHGWSSDQTKAWLERMGVWEED